MRKEDVLLEEWLSVALRQSPEGPFETWDVIESPNQTLSSADVLVPDLVDHLMGESFLRRAKARLHGGALRSLVEAREAELGPMGRGVFGEVLAARLLESFHGLQVPVKKLRYRTARYDSPKATDVVAIKLDRDGRIASVAYAEVKLRTTRNRLTSLVLHAHNQLQSDCIPQTPAIMGFMVQILAEKDDPLADSLMDYLSDRSDTEIDTHHIFIVVENGCWRDSDLTCLEDHDALLEPLAVHVVRITDLPTKVGRAYSQVGFEALDDDD